MKVERHESQSSMKGQYFSFDALISSAIFILALISLLATWQSLRTSLEHQSSPTALEALRIGETLLGPGSSTSSTSVVDCSEMDVPGIAVSWDDRRVDSSKLDSCALLDADTLKSKLATSYSIDVRIDGEHKLGDDITKAGSVSEIGRARKIIVLYDSTTRSEQIVPMDIYIYK